MNQRYNDLENKFPIEVDDFARYSDPNLAAMQYINQYYALYNAGDYAGANDILESYPQLKTMIVNAANMNKQRDAIISVQRFFFDEVQEYLVDIVKNKGMYSASTKYTKYDVVGYANNGTTEYFMGIAIDIPVGTSPLNADYYVPLVLRGEQGASGTGLSPRGVWNSSTSYSKDDCVSYNNFLWYALTNNVNKTPTYGGGYWASIEISAGGVYVGNTAPESTTTLWVDTSAGGQTKYWNGSAWVSIVANAVWG